jgi:hypothetical protein
MFELHFISTPIKIPLLSSHNSRFLIFTLLSARNVDLSLIWECVLSQPSCITDPSFAPYSSSLQVLVSPNSLSLTDFFSTLDLIPISFFSSILVLLLPFSPLLLPISSSHFGNQKPVFTVAGRELSVPNSFSFLNVFLSFKLISLWSYVI